MRTKDFYQEEMLGYLGGVQKELEALERSRILFSDLTDVYRYLDRALERLWRLIRAGDADWELFRFTLEASCEDLLRALYRVLRHRGNLEERRYGEVYAGKWKPLFTK